MTRVVATLAILWLASPAVAWDLGRHSIPVGEIRSGGPPRHGIPALLEPRFVPAGEASLP